MTPLDLPLRASPATRQSLLEARAVAILVGSYDGSGNFGDIAQLDAALQLLKPLAPGLLVLPVLERGFREVHREMLATFQLPPEHAIFFDPERAWDDDLLPLAVPPTLAAAAIYLYGGGYLNPSWGDRKLAMARVAEDLLRGAGVTDPVRLASGLQVDPAWLSSVAAGDLDLLRSFELLGARDPLSARALTELGSAGTVLETGDDALGAVPVIAATGGRLDSSTELQVNLHFGDHEWVSGRSDELRDVTVDLIEELGRRADRPVRVRPLIAYLDGRTDERPALATIATEATRRGIAIEEPRVVRPSALAALLPELEPAAATISCSYHVALTSLLLGIPTVLFADNPYYEQKAAGLLAAFRLPPAFGLSADSDPGPVAAAILDDGGMRREISRHAKDLRRVRAVAEAEVLGRLAGGVMAQLQAETGQLEKLLRERSAEPAELRVELASLQTQTEELRRPAIDAAVHAAQRSMERAEQRARKAEDRAGQSEADAAAAHARLAEVFGSHTWKLMEPLRRIGRALRRLTGGRRS
jgi:polysaccharide pyruvyl transferase WcaK-like protein